MRTMYAILSESDYHTINAAISTALGYPDNTGTEVYNTTEPDVVDGFCVMPVTVEVQEVCPEVVDGYTLMDVKPELTPQQDEFTDFIHDMPDTTETEDDLDEYLDN